MNSLLNVDDLKIATSGMNFAVDCNKPVIPGLIVADDCIVSNAVLNFFVSADLNEAWYNWGWKGSMSSMTFFPTGAKGEYLKFNGEDVEKFTIIFQAVKDGTRVGICQLEKIRINDKEDEGFEIEWNKPDSSCSLLLIARMAIVGFMKAYRNQ